MQVDIYRNINDNKDVRAKDNAHFHTLRWPVEVWHKEHAALKSTEFIAIPYFTLPPRPDTILLRKPS